LRRMLTLGTLRRKSYSLRSMISFGNRASLCQAPQRSQPYETPFALTRMRQRL
jgi:hypothetical protein